MNVLLDIVFYTAITIGVVNVSLAVWILCTKRGRQYWENGRSKSK